MTLKSTFQVTDPQLFPFLKDFINSFFDIILNRLHDPKPVKKITVIITNFLHIKNYRNAII